MHFKTDETQSYVILTLILLGFSYYFYDKSLKFLPSSEIASYEVTISGTEPHYSDYEDTDDLKFHFKEYPDHIFVLDNLKIESDKAYIMLHRLQQTQKVIFDVEKDELNRKIKKSTLSGKKREINILGIRSIDSEEVPIFRYNINKVANNKAYYYLSVFGAAVILFLALYKKKVKNKNDE